LLPVAAYAVCEEHIWVQDMSDCHYSHMYQLMENGESCNNEVCVCAYYQTSSIHYESGPCDDRWGGFM
jgi:hypothetical protein